MEKKAERKKKMGEWQEKMEWLSMVSDAGQIQKIVEMNERTEKFGLVFTEEEAKNLVKMRRESLQEQQRVEFGEGILPKLIDTFCDSPYIDRNNYMDTIIKLQEIFYLYKNESMDELSDDELLEYMKEAFDGVCEGSLEYLEETVLDGFARDIRRQGRGFFGRYYKIRGRDEEDE